MRVSEVLKVKFPHSSFVVCDWDLITQSRTWHSCGRCISLYVTSSYGTENMNNKLKE